MVLVRLPISPHLTSHTTPHTQALNIDRTNVKAYYRMAEGYIGLSELDLAESELQKALQYQPQSQ